MENEAPMTPPRVYDVLTGRWVTLPPENPTSPVKLDAMTELPWRQRGSAVSTVTPAPGVLPGQNLRSWANWRAAAYSVIPPVIATVTAWQTQFHDRVSPWILVALAVIGPLLSALNTTDKLRQVVYSVCGLLSTGGFIATLFIGHEAWIPMASAAVAIVSDVMARFYVPTTTLQPS